MFTCLKVAGDRSCSCTADPAFPDLSLVPDLPQARAASNTGERAGSRQNAGFQASMPKAVLIMVNILLKASMKVY